MIGARAGAWSVAGGILSRGLAHGSTLVLMLLAARLLDPATFGAFVLSNALVALGMLFIYAGVYEYILRADEGRLRDKAAFSLLLALALVLAVLHLMGASLAARMFASPELAAILQAYAAIPLAGCLSAWREARFLRDSRNLPRYNLLITCRDLACLALGVAGLLLGFGLVALVAWRLSTALLGWAIWRVAAPFEPSLDGRPAHWREVVAYGGGIAASRIAAFAEANGVDILLGLLCPPAIVGVYRMASRLIGAVVDLLAQPLAKLAWVRVSEAARLGHDPQVESLAWNHLMLLLAWPALVFVALDANSIVHVVLGPRWQAAIPVIYGLAGAASIRCSTFSLEPLFAAQGRAPLLMRLRSTGALLALGAVAISAPFGLVAVAAGQAVAALASVLLTLRVAHTQVGLKMSVWAGSFRHPLLIVASMALTAEVFGWSATYLGAPRLAVPLSVAAVGLVLSGRLAWLTLRPAPGTPVARAH